MSMAPSTQARAPPRKRPPRGGLCAADAPPRCTGHFCSSAGGVGPDNPKDPKNLDDVQKSKAVSFFFKDFSKFDVSDALAARTTARRVGRAQRQVHPGRRALGHLPPRPPPPCAG